MSWSNPVAPIVFTLFLWWFSTGAILYLDGLRPRTFRWSLGAASFVAIGALYALRTTSEDTGASAMYCAFTCTILIWGWVEMAFLMGFVTGPRASPCPAGARGWRRAGFAFETIAYHEIALLVAGSLIAALTWNAPNQLGLESFAVLWISRQSTKLNLFLGVRNLSEEFLPDHLRYLESYFTRRPMNLLFPLSVTAGTCAAALLWNAALGQGTPASTAIALTFLATLLTLALLEHWFLVAPINVSALWNWSLGNRGAENAVADHTQPSDPGLRSPAALPVDGDTQPDLCHSRT